MIYICPNCNKEMLPTHNYVAMGWEPDRECKDCKIIFVTAFEIDGVKKGECLEYTDGSGHIARGTFDYCCRVYKLKVFS